MIADLKASGVEVKETHYESAPDGTREVTDEPKEVKKNDNTNDD